MRSTKNNQSLRSKFAQISSPLKYEMRCYLCLQGRATSPLNRAKISPTTHSCLQLECFRSSFLALARKVFFYSRLNLSWADDVSASRTNLFSCFDCSLAMQTALLGLLQRSKSLWEPEQNPFSQPCHALNSQHR